MATITLKRLDEPTATYVSNSFIDDKMLDADGEYVKLYLYLLRCMSDPGNGFSLSAAAGKLHHTEQEIERALTYWEKAQLLYLQRNENKEISGIALLPENKNIANTLREEGNAAVASTAPSAATASALASTTTTATTGASTAPSAATFTERAESSDYPSYSRNQIASLQEQDGFRQILTAAQHYRKKTLTASDTHYLAFWYDDLKLPADLIEYIMEYTIEQRGNTSLHYMDAIARSWAQEGIRSVKDAKAHTEQHQRLTSLVKKHLGIAGRMLSPNEIATIKKWKEEYDFSDAMIQLACEKVINSSRCSKTIDSTHRNFLSKWYREGLKTPEQVAQAEEQRKASYQTSDNTQGTAPSKTYPNRFNQFSQRQHDAEYYRELERETILRQKEAFYRSLAEEKEESDHVTQ